VNLESQSNRITITRRDIASIDSVLKLSSKGIPVTKSNVKYVYRILNYWFKYPEKCEDIFSSC